VAEIKQWAKAEGVPIHYFKKGETKEAIAEPLLEGAAKEGGEGRAVLLGIAQEEASAWRSWRPKDQRFAGRPPLPRHRASGRLASPAWPPVAGPLSSMLTCHDAREHSFVL